MEVLISTDFAGNALLFILGFLFIFHLLILMGRIPYDIVWAGRIENRDEMVRMESFSLLVVVMAIVIVALRMRYLNFWNDPTFTEVGIWILVAFFSLNTLGNLTAKSPLEKYGFGLLTLVISLLMLRLAIGS
jgi:hypothetical protein